VPKTSLELSLSFNNQSFDSMGNSTRTGKTAMQPITTLAEFLYSQIQLKEFQLLRLIATDILTENGCIIMADAGLNAWPLICDGTWYSVEWIRLFLTNKKLIVVRYHVSLSLFSLLFSSLLFSSLLAIANSIGNSLVRRIAFVDH
jgi:hypothetical protein